MKIVVVGPSAVGKSSITVRFVKNEFVGNYSPTLEDSYQLPVDVGGEVQIVEIIDTAGSEYFGQLKDMYYHKADGFLLVCSVDSCGSLQELQNVKKDIHRVKETEDVPMVVCVNKEDLSQMHWRKTKNQMVAELQKWKIPYYFTSAKTAKNIQASFTSLVKSTNGLKTHHEKKMKHLKKIRSNQCCVM